MPSNHFPGNSDKNQTMVDLTADLSHLSLTLDKSLRNSSDTLTCAMKRISDEIANLRRDIMDIQKSMVSIEDAFRTSEITKTQHISSLTLTCEKICMMLGGLDNSLARLCNPPTAFYAPFMHPYSFMPASVPHPPFSFPLHGHQFYGSVPPPHPPPPHVPNMQYTMMNDRVQTQRPQAGFFPCQGPPPNYFAQQGPVPVPLVGMQPAAGPRANFVSHQRNAGNAPENFFTHSGAVPASFPVMQAAAGSTSSSGFTFAPVPVTTAAPRIRAFEQKDTLLEDTLTLFSSTAQVCDINLKTENATQFDCILEVSRPSNGPYCVFVKTDTGCKSYEITTDESLCFLSEKSNAAAWRNRNSGSDRILVASFKLSYTLQNFSTAFERAKSYNNSLLLNGTGRSNNEAYEDYEKDESYDYYESSDTDVIIEESADDSKERSFNRGGIFKLKNYDENGWNCSTCMVRNPESATQCRACQEQKVPTNLKTAEVSSKSAEIKETKSATNKMSSSMAEASESKSTVFSLNSALANSEMKSVFSFAASPASTSSSLNITSKSDTSLAKSLFSTDAKSTEKSSAPLFGNSGFSSFSNLDSKPKLNFSIPTTPASPSNNLKTGSFGNTSKPVFGQKSFQNLVSSTPATSSSRVSTSSQSLFNTSSSSGQSIFGGAKNLFGSPVSQMSNAFQLDPTKSIFGQMKTLAPSNVSSLNKSSDGGKDVSSEANKFLDKSSASLQKAVTEGDDENYDPQYEPILKMPDSVEICSGEEHDVVLFQANARLYRYVEDQWKERGRGVIKILKMPSGSSRLLFRRDHVHKVACNHTISPQMNMRPMKNSALSLCWVAIDYAENPSGQKENFCLRFKEENDAKEFSKVVEDAKVKKEA